MNDQNPAPQPAVDENSLIAERRAKLTALRGQGIAYPNDFRREQFAGPLQAEFADAERGYTAVRHQAEVGTGYFDAVSTAVNPESSTTALSGSTESEQFH